ncbi:unnamed protein product [Adineta steineri]|uniref:Uncharacterized protein n=1 Tax=Adineta steineri TaxID=433720 RepID=A0A814C4M3_9BILA|nr:unnamed protein product [Adineta steineri]CAF4098933.1 unnamed protein product [Adineta steineri]
MMNNGSMLTTNNINDNLSANSGFFSAGSTIVIIQLSILSLTVILAIAYSTLILIRPAFRKNKLNWFTVNVCLASAWLVPSAVLQGVIALISTNQPVRTFLIESVTKRRPQV